MSADETSLSLGVSVDGVAESVAALGEVAQAEKRLADASMRAASQLSTENVAAFRKARAEYESLKTVADQVARAQAGVGGASKDSGVKIGQFGSSVALAGQAVSKLSPQLGQLTTMAGSSLGAMQSLATAGMGPLGAAVAGISLAVTAGTALWELYAESNRAAEAAAKTLSESLEANEYALTAIMSEQAKHRADIATRIRVLSESATTDELLAERERLNRTLALMRGTALEGSAAMTDILRQRLDLEDRMTVEAVQARADAVYAIESKAARNVADAWMAQEQRRLADKEAHTGAYARRSGPTAAETTQRVVGEAVNPLLAAMDSNRAARDEELRLNVSAAAEVEGIEKEHLDRMRELRESAAEEVLARTRNDKEKQLAAIRRSLDQEVAAHKKAQAAIATVGQAAGDAAALLTSVVEASAGSSERAQKKKLQTEAGISAVNSGIQAVVQSAMAVGSYPDPAGMASHGASAVGFTIAAAKAAIVAGGGGGSAGSGTPSAAAQAGGGGGASSSRPSAFDRAPPNDTGGGGPSKVVYQVGTFPLVTEQEIGRAVGRFDRIGRRATKIRVT